MSSFDSNSTTFVSLLTKHQPDLRAYIITLMPGSPDASDVLQKVNIVLWTKKNRFDIDTNFKAWSFTVARFEVMAHFKKQKRNKIVLLDEELLDMMATEVTHSLENHDQRLSALEHCIQSLRPQDRQLLDHRYGSGHGLDVLAKILGRSVSALSVSLHRLRSALRECVNNRLLRQEDLS